MMSGYKVKEKPASALENRKGATHMPVRKGVYTSYTLEAMNRRYHLDWFTTVLMTEKKSIGSGKVQQFW